MNIDESKLIIDVHNLEKKFKDSTAVSDVSLEVKYGEIFGFLGSNGAGKTTTIRMLCGLLTPDSGRGTCLGYDILTESDKIKKHVGYIPQFFGLYKQLTVYENLMFIAELYGVLNRKTKVNSVMDQLDLISRRNQLSGSLSGGWKQRLSLAAALVHDPFLLILDEPTASVDPKTRRDFWEIMHNLSAQGMTILLSSHNMDDVQRCNRIAYISNGQLLMHGKIDDIIQNVNLSTWRVTGKNLILLAEQLQKLPEIDQVVTFYDSLHVSGRDKAILNKAIEPYRHNPNFHWEMTDSKLEEVFIWLSKTVKPAEKKNG
ncbi:MAG: ABC transporter ATP-binding protein [Gammaproteobacteria bacterium]